MFITDKPVPAEIKSAPGLVAWVIPMDHEAYSLYRAAGVAAVGSDEVTDPDVVKALAKEEREAILGSCKRLQNCPMPDGTTRDFEGKELRALLIDFKPYRILMDVHMELWIAVTKGRQNVLDDATGKGSGSPSSPKTS